MKKFSLIIALMGLFTFANAQVVEVAITETDKSMSQGLKPACVVTLENCNKKDVEKSWGKYMKSYGKKTKKVKKSSDILTDDAKISGMSNNTVDVYAVFNQKGSNVEATVWYDLGGAYLTSSMHPDGFPMAQKMLNGFANQVAKEGVENDLGIQEKSLKKLNGDLKGLEKKKSSLEDEIKKFEKKIEDARAAIEQNVVDQENKANEIKAQQEVVEKVKDQLKKFKK